VELPLGGRRIVDLTLGISGAYCAKLLSGAGAEVVKVEPHGGDPLRRWSCADTVAAGDDGALFQSLHHGHRAVVTDDGTADDELLAGADVLLTDRFDAAAVSARHPHLVVTAITPWGLEGPYRDRPATELVIQAESGCLAAHGRADRPPFQCGGQITEWVTGVYAAVATAAALRSPGGRLVDVSWLDIANLTGTNFGDLFDSLRGRPLLDTVARSMETPSIEPTLDGYVGFNTNTRQQFEDFTILIDRLDLLDDPQWPLLGTRVTRWDEWNAIVHEWTTKHTTAEIVERAAALRIPCAPVADAPELIAIDHVVERGVFVDDPTGSFRVPRRPWTIDGEPAPPPAPAPRLGEHTGQIAPRPAPASPPAPASGLPLEGIRVVDLTAWWAGPSAAGMLAALGADVVHVESTKRPDGMRMAGGMFFHLPNWWERSGFFLQANTNKRDLTLDLSTPRGQELALELIQGADVVIENFTPRVLASFGLGWDVIHAASPSTILVRMPAFGLTGPWRDRPGFAQTMEQVTGLAWLTGHVDDQPRIQRGPCDPNGGMHATFATLMALAHRDRTGTGCFVEAPMFEAALNVAAELTIEYTAYGTRLTREGNRSPHAAPQNVYASAESERWLAVSIATDAQWQGLCRTVGRTDWAADPRFSTHRGRRTHQDELDDAIAAWAAERTVGDAVAALVAEGVPAGDTVDPRRASEQPQLAARRFFESVEHPVIGPHLTPGLPFRYSGVDHWIRRHAPVLGEHNDEILAALGVDDAERALLTERGVIGTRPVGL